MLMTCIINYFSWEENEEKKDINMLVNSIIELIVV